MEEEELRINGETEGGSIKGFYVLLQYTILIDVFARRYGFNSPNLLVWQHFC